MTRVSRYGKVRPKVGFLTFGRTGSKTFRVAVSVNDNTVARIVEEYRALGWDCIAV